MNFVGGMLLCDQVPLNRGINYAELLYLPLYLFDVKQTEKTTSLKYWWRIHETFSILPLFSSPEPKARVSYCHSAPSVVRPSVRRRPSVVVRPSSVWRKLFTFSTSSPEPLDGFWWNLVCMKYSWSLTSVVVFRPDPPRGGSRAGQK